MKLITLHIENQWKSGGKPVSMAFLCSYFTRERSIRSHAAVEVGAHKLTISYARGEIWGKLENTR